jgi:hypothetical protein
LRSFQKEGLKATVSSIMENVCHRMYLWPVIDESEFVPDVGLVDKDLPPETELIKAGGEHVRLLEQLPTTVLGEVARERM